MRHQHRLFYRRVLLGILTGVLVLLAGVVGCDQDTRYKVLTVFFEGVPKPGEENPRARWNVKQANVSTLHKEEIDLEQERAVVREKMGQKLPSRHDFSRDCAQCHTGGLTSGQQELRTPLPELCYSCHEDLYPDGAYLHGPLNVGECVFCHDPHQSAFIHLQKAPQPDLCYRCHQRNDIALIPGHDLALEGICTDCHEPHAGSGPMLLKAAPVRQEDPNQIN